MTKYRVTTKTEDIIITANSKEQLETKVEFIKSFATVVNVALMINC